MTKYPKVELPPQPEFSDYDFTDTLKLQESDYLKKYRVSAKEGNTKDSIFRADVYTHHFPIFQHEECVCPDCEVVSWIQYGPLDYESQPYCPLCNKILRSDINSAEKMFHIREDEMEEYLNSLHTERILEIPFQNKLHV
nr:hypothetical protein [uncultured Carboxylicivirga sp.]